MLTRGNIADTRTGFLIIGLLLCLLGAFMSGVLMYLELNPKPYEESDIPIAILDTTEESDSPAIPIVATRETNSKLVVYGAAGLFLAFLFALELNSRRIATVTPINTPSPMNSKPVRGIAFACPHCHALIMMTQEGAYRCESCQTEGTYSYRL